MILSGEPKQVIYTIGGGEVELELRLNIPNNNHIDNIAEIPFFEEFEKFQGFE